MSVVFFPGKFQPPHIGHVLTISKLRNEYPKIIVGISDDEPRVMSFEEIRDTFDTIFRDQIEIVYVKGVLTQKNDLNELPSFDFLASGNEKVLEWGKKMGLSVKNIPRSKGVGYSGTELRALYKNKKQSNKKVFKQ